MSSPTSWIFPPRRSVSSFHPFQSFSAMPSSIEMIGYFLIQLFVEIDHLFGRLLLPLALEIIYAVLEEFLAAASRPRKTSCPACIPGLFDRFKDYLDRFFIGFQVRGEPAFVSHRCIVSLLLQDRSSGCETLRRPCGSPRRKLLLRPG